LVTAIVSLIMALPEILIARILMARLLIVESWPGERLL